MIVDMHCHVLPGVDDGPKTMEDSMKVLAEVARQGVGEMIVTPHFHPGRYKVYASQVMETLTRTQAEAEKRNIAVRLIPGQECYYYSELTRELNAGHVLTMAGSRYVLVEFEPDAMYSTVRNGIRDLVSHGYLPIVAHFERYRCLEGEPERMQQLRGDGAALQMNFGRLTIKENIFRRNPWRRLLRDGFVDYLGSDTHGMEFRPPHIAEAVAWLEQETPGELAHKILTYNIQAILNH